MTTNLYIFHISLFITLITPLIFPTIREEIIEDFKYGFHDIPQEINFLLQVTFYLIGAIIFSLIITFPILNLVSTKKHTYSDIREYNTEKNIQSLYLNEKVNTQQEIENKPFRIGTNILETDINTDSYFYFFSEENEAYVLDKVTTTNSTIIESDNIQPKIITKKETEVLVTETMPTIIGNIIRIKPEVKETILSDTTQNYIYIPTDSIIEIRNQN